MSVLRIEYVFLLTTKRPLRRTLLHILNCRILFYISNASALYIATKSTNHACAIENTQSKRESLSLWQQYIQNRVEMPPQHARL